MSRLITILLMLSFLPGCKKEVVADDDISFISFINTVPGVGTISVYFDTTYQFRVPYQGSYRNGQLSEGPHIISIKDSAKVKTFANLPFQDFFAGKSSTIIAYDTLHPLDSTIKAIRLTDDLTLAPSGYVKVRFIHAAFTPSVDITFLRTNTTPADSLTFSMQSYVGLSPNDPILSAFKNIPIGTYSLKIKRAGTQETIMNNTMLSVSNLAGVAGISGISTIYFSGGAQGKPLSIGLLRHYP
ncbi:MAG: DUF4397 domain-containing protein [Ferruginibacter sp.]